MTPVLLPASADRSGVFVKVFNTADQTDYVVPLDQAAGVSGSATLVAGTIAVADTNILADSRVFLSRKTIGGTAGNLTVAVTAGVGFTITSSNALDTSVVDYLVQY